jgi:hypothetical protein
MGQMTFNAIPFDSTFFQIQKENYYAPGTFATYERNVWVMIPLFGAWWGEAGWGVLILRKKIDI